MLLDHWWHGCLFACRTALHVVHIMLVLVIMQMGCKRHHRVMVEF